MTHEVLLRVVDVASLDANKGDVRRIKWHLALLLKFCMLYIFSYIYSCVLSVCVVGH